MLKEKIKGEEVEEDFEEDEKESENEEEIENEDEEIIEKLESIFTDFKPSFVRTIDSTLKEIADAPQKLEFSLGSFTTKKNEEKIDLDYSGKYIENENKKYDEMPKVGMEPQIFQTRNVDVMNLGRDMEFQTREATFRNPESSRIKKSGRLEDDYISAEKVDLEKVGREPHFKKEYEIK